MKFGLTFLVFLVAINSGGNASASKFRTISRAQSSTSTNPQTIVAEPKPQSVTQRASVRPAIATPSLNDDKPPPMNLADFHLKSKDYARFSKSEVEYLIGKKSVIDDNGSLPFIPPGITNVTELRHMAVNRSHHISNFNLTSELQTNIKLVHLTDTYLSCYIAPPEKTFVNMFDLMGMWYVVKMVNNVNLTDSKYDCEEIIYTPTGYNTFDKISDVHFRHKWLTIRGNGTFISPGIVIIDWKDLTSPTKPDRLVYTVLGTDYDHWLVGYDCRTGIERPEIVLQTRHRVVPLKYLEEAYRIIKNDNLPLNDLVCEGGF